jgi:DNA-binding transcriptional regulator YiaG
MMDSQPDVHALLKLLRLSYKDAATLLGVSTGAVGHWMSGKREPSGPTRRLLFLLENGKNTAAVKRLKSYR